MLNYLPNPTAMNKLQAVIRYLSLDPTHEEALAQVKSG